MNAIDYINTAFKEFALQGNFSLVDQQILREGTVAEVSFKSDSLKIMIKLFISEMEGEGGVYVAPSGTALGYREAPNWLSDWTIANQLAALPQHDRTPLNRILNAPLPSSPLMQLRASLEWLTLNSQLITEFFGNHQSNCQP